MRSSPSSEISSGSSELILSSSTACRKPRYGRDHAALRFFYHSDPASRLESELLVC